MIWSLPGALFFANLDISFWIDPGVVKRLGLISSEPLIVIMLSVSASALDYPRSDQCSALNPPARARCFFLLSLHSSHSPFLAVSHLGLFRLVESGVVELTAE